MDVDDPRVAAMLRELDAERLIREQETTIPDPCGADRWAYNGSERLLLAEIMEPETRLAAAVRAADNLAEIGDLRTKLERSSASEEDQANAPVVFHWWLDDRLFDASGAPRGELSTARCDGTFGRALPQLRPPSADAPDIGLAWKFGAAIAAWKNRERLIEEQNASHVVKVPRWPGAPIAPRTHMLPSELPPFRWGHLPEGHPSSGEQRLPPYTELPQYASVRIDADRKARREEMRTLASYGRGQAPRCHPSRIGGVLQATFLHDIEARSVALEYLNELMPPRRNRLCGVDKRTLRRVLADGRRAWAELGEWPWAASPQGGGRLLGPKGDHRWWLIPAYAEALERWALGTS